MSSRDSGLVFAMPAPGMPLNYGMWISCALAGFILPAKTHPSNMLGLPGWAWQIAAINWVACAAYYLIARSQGSGEVVRKACALAAATSAALLLLHCVVAFAGVATPHQVPGVTLSAIKAGLCAFIGTSGLLVPPTLALAFAGANSLKDTS